MTKRSKLALTGVTVIAVAGLTLGLATPALARALDPADSPTPSVTSTTWTDDDHADRDDDNGGRVDRDDRDEAGDDRDSRDDRDDRDNRDGVERDDDSPAERKAEAADDQCEAKYGDDARECAALDAAEERLDR
ncbi:hypothetical protein OG394_22665 [Kribbella sp. NBC_01245]|uniref:hypothetical protein n=1 Tax=Kribbella sp. NBC_01245 TaxID=2903578 RepID=UPI002E2DBE30|nr:hypothetical protein [Kribbella sp. NBC_01245]